MYPPRAQQRATHRPPRPIRVILSKAKDLNVSDMRNWVRDTPTRIYAIASGIAFFHFPCAFKINSTVSRIAPSPPFTVVT